MGFLLTFLPLLLIIGIIVIVVFSYVVSNDIMKDFQTNEEDLPEFEDTMKEDTGITHDQSTERE